MKRILFLLLAAVILCGCEKINREDPSKDDITMGNEISSSQSSDFTLPEVLVVSTSDEGEQNEDQAQTRTYVGQDGYKILWQKGDAVSYFAGNIHNVRYAYLGEDELEEVSLDKDNEKSGTTAAALSTSLAIYPYDENITVVSEDEVDIINLTYPATQKYSVNSFAKDVNVMVAAGKNNQDNNVHFRNACGYLVVKLYGQGTDGNPSRIKSISLTSLSGEVKIAGPAAVEASNDAEPIITMADNASDTITLDCRNDDTGVVLGADAEHATEFWFCLPPVSFTGGIKITITDIYGNEYTKQTSKTVNIERNNIQPMAAFEVVSKAPTTTKIWYTRSDASERTPVKFYDDAADNIFNANWVRHGWDETEGKFILILNTPLTTIPAQAFRNTDITTIVLPEGITTIEREAFRNTPLTEITIPGSMNLIEQDAFYDCEYLTSVTLLPSPTKTPLKIGYTVSTLGAKYGPFFYTKLNTIDVNRELILVNGDNNTFTPTQWDEGIFVIEDYEDVNSVSVTIGPQVETISNYMFNWLNIETLTIPGTVKTIGNCVFDGCKKLTSLVYEPSPTGESLTHGYNDDSYDEGPFIDAPLTGVDLNREIVYTYPDNSLNEANEGLFGGRSTLTNITIGDQVKTLPGYMLANTGITSIDLNNVSTIGKGALLGTNCTSIEIPASVTSIGDYAFADSQIQTIDLSQVKTIGNGALRGTKFTSITIPGTVTKIGDDVFNGCTSLSEVTFEGSTAQLTVGYNTDGADEGLFVDAPLTTVNLNRDIIYTFPAGSLDTPAEGLFGNKSSLVNITLGDNAKTLTGYMFANAGIESIDLNKVTTIGKGALEGISKITELTIPASVTSIGDFAFKNCSKLTTLVFAEGYDDLIIGYQPGGDEHGPFYQSPLTSIVVNRSLVLTDAYATACDQYDEGIFSTNPELGSRNTTISLGGQVGKIPEFMFSSLPLTEITIPATVTEISNDAFTNCKNLSVVTFEESSQTLTIGYNTVDTDEGPFVDAPLTKVTLKRPINYTFPNPDTAIEGLFGGKSNLTEVELGQYVNNISDYMFANTGIQTLSLPITNVETIGNGAFSGSKLLQITIPYYVRSIGVNAFVNCDYLAEVYIQGTTTALTVGYQNTGGADWGPFYDSPLSNIVLGREINYVDKNGNAFTPVEASDGFFASEESVNNVEVTIFDNVKTISNYMFAGIKMNSLSIPNSVTKIGKYAFYGCSTLSSVNIPSGVTEIDEYTFSGCSSLTGLTIPANVTTIGDYAFYGCSSLSDLTIASATTPLTFGYQPSNNDDRGPFYQSPLRSIRLDRPIAMTEEYNTYCDQWDEGIFSNSSYNADGDWVTDLVLGPNVKTILKYMFAGTRVQQLHIPETIDEIGVNVVENNEKLNAIIFYDTKVRPNVEHGAFGVNSTGLEMDWEHLDPSIEAYPPGKYQYYIFVPLRLGRDYNTLYFSDEELNTYTYWDDLHAIMVDDMPGRYNYFQKHEVDKRHHESRYLDVPGYEWYRTRYYDEQPITPPAF